MGTPRNAPCPCGSGRKFKRCCARTQGRVESRVDLDGALERLFEALWSRRYREHLTLARAWLESSWAKRLPPRIYASLGEAGTLESRATWFAIFDFPVAGRERTLVREFLDRRGRRLSGPERRGLERLLTVRFELLECEAIDEEGYIRVRLLGETDERFHARPMEEFLLSEPGDLVIARVAGPPGERVFLEEFPVPHRLAERTGLRDLFLRTPPEERKAAWVHGLWLTALLERIRDNLRSEPRTRYPYCTADLRDYLDAGTLSHRLTPEARRLATYLGRIVAGAARVEPEGPHDPVETGVACRRRPGHRKCSGVILAERDRADRIHWTCTRCKDSGTITGWRDTPFDPTPRQREAEIDVESGREVHLSRELSLPAGEYRRLLGMRHLGGRTLHLLLSVQGDVEGDDPVLLSGDLEDLRDLARSIAVHLALTPDLSGAAWRSLAGLHHGITAMLGEPWDLSPAACGAELLLFRRASRRRPRSSLPAGERTGALRLNVRLEGLAPSIHRRLDVPGDYTLEDLHEALVLAFGWSGELGHLFLAGERRFACPRGGIEGAEDERAVRLDRLFSEHDRELVWIYGTGETWRHRVEFEALLPETLAAPRLLEGARATPPEGCGGSSAYSRLLESLATPSPPDRDEPVDPFEGFDPEAFDLELHAARLRRMAAGASATAGVSST